MSIMSPKVSVIVAVYNAEKTLRRCLDSLKSQHFQEIEFVLIDDGSTDASLSICEQYQAEDSRFRVFHQENKGVSRARQTGLFLSTGEYFICLDADDYALPDAYQALYLLAQESNADIVYSDYLKLLSDVTLLVPSAISHCTAKKMLDDTIYHNRGFLCNHMLRRSIINEYEVSFPPKMNFGEDQYFMINLLSCAIKDHRELRIAYLNQPVFYYDKTANPHSLTSLDARRKCESKYSWWKETGKLIEGVNSEKPYYSVLVADAFYAFWNRILTRDEFVDHYSLYAKSIRKHAVCGSRKLIVFLAAKGHYDFARRVRLICAPSILYERFLQKKNRNSQRLK
jgi:glycosyltransferase involved in cell wall biosynthesis